MECTLWPASNIRRPPPNVQLSTVGIARLCWCWVFDEWPSHHDRWIHPQPSCRRQRPVTLLGHTINVCRLRELVKATDLVVVDLDGSLFPGYSQAVLGAFVLWRPFRKPLRCSDRRCVEALLGAGVSITWSKACRPSNRRLLSVYGEVTRGVPERYFLEEVERLPRYCRRGAADVVELLSRQAVVGIVSLGVDLIAKEFVRRLRASLSTGAIRCALIERTRGGLCWATGSP